MSMRRRPSEKQESLWVATGDLAASPGHPFYERLNKVLAEAEFDRKVEDLCAPFYAEKKGRPSIAPGVYMRMLMIGYFEGIDSERGIAWRCADSLALRRFLGYDLSQDTPDHSSLSRIRTRLDLEDACRALARPFAAMPRALVVFWRIVARFSPRRVAAAFARNRSGDDHSSTGR